MSIVIAVNPNIPYVSNPIKCCPGQIIKILGMINISGKRIAINLQNGSQTKIIEDVPLHIDFRPVEENCIVRNSYQNGCWGHEERDGGCPIRPGEFFELLIEIGSKSFRIAINGTHFCEYEYRLPISLVNFLHIYRHADISTVSLENLGISQYLGISQVKYPMLEMIHNKSPFIMSIGREGLYDGRHVLIYGKTTFDADRISINFQNTDSKNPESDFNTLIGFHMSVRFLPNQNNAGVIVFNTFKGHWLTEERYNNFPFNRNGNYVISILAKEDHFKIVINKNHTYNFQYRAPLFQCKYLYVFGDTSVKATT